MRHALMLIVLLAIASGSTAAAAMELVMFRRAGCPWCAAWDREVGPVYPKTALGQRLPVRFVDLDRDQGAVAGLKSPVRYTPTFVVFDGGREIGRIEGYPGQDFFWGLLDNAVPKGAQEPAREPAQEPTAAGSATRAAPPLVPGG
jgi:thioredoxin-related protein